MKKILHYSCGLLAWLLLLAPGLIQAQTEKEWLADLAEEEEEAINALVLYPEETRLAILEVSMYPEALIKLESIQAKTKATFQAIVEKYPQGAQQQIWDLTRYPGLIDRLSEVRDASGREVDLVLDDYPSVIHERAREAVRLYGAELAAISRLNREAEFSFADLIRDYPPRTQEALNQLLELPEVLSIMTDNIKLTILVGDLYKNDPERVLQKADSLNLVVARQRAQELEDWKKSLEDDPEARAELEASTEAFAEEQGYLYDDEYYGENYDDIYYEEPEAPEVHHYYYYHYPYWFAYPSWYTYPRWREYPYWYDWGFYYGPRRTVVVINLPSFYFVNWYFYHPYHHYQWSYLSAHFTRHYYTHRNHGGSITAGVTVWQSRNRNIVSNDWLRDDGQLPERFREFGKFEAERARYNRNHPQQPLDQEEFLDRNPERYRTIAKTPRTQQRTPQPAEQRPRTPTEVERQPRTTDKDRRVLIPRKRTETEPEKGTETPRSTIPSVKRGTEQHRGVSECNKTTQPRTAQPAPPQTKAPRSTTSKPRSSTTKKSTPRKKSGGG